MKSREDGRVLVTLDNDFADIITYPPDTTEGNIVLRSVNLNNQVIHQNLAQDNGVLFRFMP